MKKEEVNALRVIGLICVVIMLFGCSSDDDAITNNGGLGNNNIDVVVGGDENVDTRVFTMPSEEETHEGTWLQWPHNFTYGYGHSQAHDATWVKMTKALHTGENVHIVVYNQVEEDRVADLLVNEGVDMTKIDFNIWQTDDYWVRDNGPIFVYDENNDLVIQNWRFNGWGNKTPFAKCNQIPTKVGQSIAMEVVDVNMVNEGGAVELDGHGTLLAKKSCIINNNRNPGLTQEQVEANFKNTLGLPTSFG